MEFLPKQDDSNLCGGISIEKGVIKGIQTPLFSSYENLGEMIWDYLSNSPEYISQIDAATGREKTVKDVKERSIRLASWMRKKGIGPGDIITICSPDHFDVDVIIFATLFVGAIYNMFPCRIDLTEARHFIKFIEPRILCVCKDNSDILKEAAELENHECEIMCLDDEDSEEESFADILKARPFDGVEDFEITKSVGHESLCVIAPTSGTTGTPKFVSYSHGKVLQRFPRNDITHKASNKSAFTLLRLFPEWEVHFEHVLALLVLKSTKIFVRNFEFLETARVIEKYQITDLVLTTYTALCYSNTPDDAFKYNVDSVLKITTMGAVFPTQQMKKLSLIFPNAFFQKQLGSTEVTAICKTTKKSRNPESQGNILPNVQLKIVDVITGEPLGPNKIGEICVKSPFIMVGYYKNPVDTALLYDDEGWFHTGDEAYYDENAEIVITGRLKDIIRSGIFDLNPSLVEQMLMSHPEIFDAAVVGIPDAYLVEKPVACIKKLDGSKINEQDVHNLLNQFEYGRICGYFVVFLDDIPRTTNGKINKRILKKQVEQMYTGHPDPTTNGE